VAVNWSSRYRLIDFVSGGRDWTGCDCWGLVCLVYKNELGVELPSYGDVSAYDIRAKVLRVKSESPMWKDVDKPKEYDVVLMTEHGSRYPGHCGVMLDGIHVMHTEEVTGVLVEDISLPTVSRRVVKVGRYSRP